jgi:MFS transporter, DHA1 family, tetracycline resistance protein
MKKSSLGIIFLVVFIDLIGFGIVIPILPYYAQAYGANAWQLGWLMAIFSLMQFLVSPLWGRLSDRIGRKPVLLISLLGTCLSMVFLGFARSLVWLFIGRAFAGIGSANISTAYAYITDVTTEENRAKGMGIVGAAFGLGFIFGPAIGGLLSPYGYDVPMFAGAGLAAINLFFAWRFLKEPPLTAEARSGNRVKRFDLKNITLTLSDPRTRIAIGIFFLVTFAIAQMETTFAIYMFQKFGLHARSAGMLLALSGLIMAAMQGGLIGRLAKKFGEKTLILAGLLITALALLGFASSGTLAGIVVSLSILSIGHGALHPSLSSLASLGASPSRRGATMGVFQSAGSLARVLGPPCAGLIYDSINHQSPFFSASVVLVLAFFIAQAAFRRQRTYQAAVVGAAGSSPS